MRKEQNLHQSTSTSKLHIKPAVSASSRQIALTCKPVPKSCTKPVSQSTPNTLNSSCKNICLAHSRLPRASPRRLPSHPGFPGSHRTCFYKSTKGWLMGFCILPFSKLRQLAGCIFYMFQSKQNTSIFWRFYEDPVMWLRMYFKRNRHTFLPLNQQLNHMATASQVPMAFKKTIRYKILQGRKLHGWKVPFCLCAA